MALVPYSISHSVAFFAGGVTLERRVSAGAELCDQPCFGNVHRNVADGRYGPGDRQTHRPEARWSGATKS